MDFPKFDGKSEPLSFINRCEDYFRRERIMEEEKVWMASRNLADDARLWFRQVQQDEGTPVWRRFTELLHRRFGSPPRPNVLHDVSTALDRVRALLEAMKERERLAAIRQQAAVRLQAAARGLLARRRVHCLRGETHLPVVSRATTWPSPEEQAAVRLQAAARGFLARRVVRKTRVLLSSSLQCAFNYTISVPQNRPAQPTSRPVLPVFVINMATGQEGRSYCLKIDPRPAPITKPVYARLCVGKFLGFNFRVQDKSGKAIRWAGALLQYGAADGAIKLSSSRASWVFMGGGDVMGSQRAANRPRCKQYRAGTVAQYCSRKGLVSIRRE